MKRMLTISALLLATTFSATALAGSNDAVLGAMVGGGTGALIGHSISGRDGALIGGALGAFTGVALATADRGRERPVVYEQPVVRERDRDWYEPQRVVFVKRYEPRRVVVIDRYSDDRGNRGYGHHRGWRNAYSYEDHDRGYNRGRDDYRDDDRGERWH